MKSNSENTVRRGRWLVQLTWYSGEGDADAGDFGDVFQVLAGRVGRARSVGGVAARAHEVEGARCHLRPRAPPQARHEARPRPEACGGSRAGRLLPRRHLQGNKYFCDIMITQNKCKTFIFWWKLLFWIITTIILTMKTILKSIIEMSQLIDIQLKYSLWSCFLGNNIPLRLFWKINCSP